MMTANRVTGTVTAAMRIKGAGTLALRLAAAAASGALAACSVATASVEPLTTASIQSSPQLADSQCRRLAAEIGDQLTIARTLPALAKAQRSQPPPSLFAALARLTGDPSIDVPGVVEFKRVRARVEDLSAQSVSRGCPPFDIATPLAEIERAFKDAAPR